jgi:glutamate-ammonia-ligase adenylyltransferase
LRCFGSRASSASFRRAGAAANAYRDYRRLQHQIRLTGAPHARVDALVQAERRAAVDALWKQVFGEAWR